MNDSRYKLLIFSLIMGIFAICVFGVVKKFDRDSIDSLYPEETTSISDYNDNYDDNDNYDKADSVPMESARKAVDNMRIGWNLGNSFDVICYPEILGTDCDISVYETYWENPVTPDTLMQKIKDLGFGAVRIPVTWNYHFDENNNIDEAWIARVQEVVDQAMEADLYCIINFHHDTGEEGWLFATDENYNENSAKYAKLWEQIAERFKDYPDKLLFEGFSEMLDDNFEWGEPNEESLDVINRYNQLFVYTVRSTGGNNFYRNLICTTYASTETPVVLRGFTVPKDYKKGHLIEQIHFYIPYAFVTKDNHPKAATTYEFNSDVEASVDKAFAIIEENTSKDIPIIIGSFGAANKNNTADRIKWYTHVIKKAKEQDITCLVWDSGIVERTGLVNRVGTPDYFPEIISACIEAAK